MKAKLLPVLLCLFSISLLNGQNIGINNNGSAPSALLDVYKNAPSANEVLFKVGASTGINRFTLDEDGDMYVAGGSILTGSLKQGGSEIGGFGIETATSIYAGDFISALGGIHVGGVTDPGTDNLVVDGIVGIGTTSPAGKMDVWVSGDSELNITSSNGSGDGFLTFRNVTTDEWSLGYDNSDGDRFKISIGGAIGSNDVFEIDASQNVYISGSGNVGIGASSLNEKLTLDGTLSLQEQASNETATSGYGKIYAKNDGKVYYRNDGGNNYDLTQGADDLGNHTATTTLNMGFQNISNANNLTLIGGISAGGTYGSNGQVLKTNGGSVSWGSVDDGIGSVTYVGTTLTIYQNDGTPHAVTISGGDNLGNHTATQDLQMSSNSIRNPTYVTNTGFIGFQGGSGTDYGSTGLTQVSGLGNIDINSGGNTNFTPGGGSVNITGDLNVTGTKAFRIDHPLDPENKYLVHSCIESDEMKNIYDGIAVLNEKGEAAVRLPDWFEAVNENFRYQLTCIGGFSNVYIKQKIENGTFIIAGGEANMEVSWQISGVRKDPGAIQSNFEVVVEKEPELRGYYLDPKAYGKSEEKSIVHKEKQIQTGDAWKAQNRSKILSKQKAYGILEEGNSSNH